MKKIIAVLLSVLLVLSVGMLFVSADDGESIDVRVTIVDDNSEFAVAYETVTVTDIDNDDTLTINDALYAAHEQFYEGGAAAGYATEMTKWGLSLMKLWGVANGGSYGYLVNNEFAWSMTDPVEENDYIAAFIYTDTEEFTDVYTYFDVQYIEEEGKDVHADLTLLKTGYDENGEVYIEPVAGAQLTMNGENMGTGFVTDDEGKIGFTVATSDPEGFKDVISAQVDGLRIVPPICILKATGDGDASPDQSIDTDAPTDGAGDDTTVHATKDEATKDSPSNIDTADNGSSNGGTSNGGATDDTATKDGAAKVDSSSASAAAGTTPKTSDVTNLILWIVIAAVCFAGIVGAVVFYKKRYGKK